MRWSTDGHNSEPEDNAGGDGGEEQLRRIEGVDAPDRVGVECDRCVFRFRETAVGIDTAGVDAIFKHAAASISSTLLPVCTP
jgi:hypothetical protein